MLDSVAETLIDLLDEVGERSEAVSDSYFRNLPLPPMEESLRGALRDARSLYEEGPKTPYDQDREDKKEMMEMAAPFRLHELSFKVGQAYVILSYKMLMKVAGVLSKRYNEAVEERKRTGQTPLVDTSEGIEAVNAKQYLRSAYSTLVMMRQLGLEDKLGGVEEQVREIYTALTQEQLEEPIVPRSREEARRLLEAEAPIVDKLLANAGVPSLEALKQNLPEA